MSAQAGIFCLHDQTIPTRAAERLDDALRDLGPDGAGLYTGQGVCLVHRALHISPHDALECQPLRSQSRAVMTWDGRLDNRDELALRFSRHLEGAATDAALAMAAYNAGGIGGLANLIGDWTLVVWNALEQSVTIANDFLGTRPIYYHESESILTWATTPDALLNEFGSRVDLDHEFLIAHVTSNSSLGRTPYRQIHQLPGGCATTWFRDGRRVTRSLWEPGADTVRYRDPEVYAERLRELFLDAIRGRLRSNDPIWIELSGGYDSSSIACAADIAVRAGLVQSPGIRTISHVSDLIHASDERPFITAVEEHLGTRGVHLRIEDHHADSDDLRGWTSPLHPHGCSLSLLKAVRERSGRLVLSGDGGDHIMGNTPDASGSVLEDVAGGQLLSALRELHAWSRASQQTIWSLGWRLASQVTSMRGQRVRRLIRHQLPAAHRFKAIDVRRIAADAFHLTPDACDTWEHLWADHFGTSPERFTPHQTIRGALRLLRLVHPEPSSLVAGVSRTYPYLHRPLVEFILSIPLGVLVRPGEPRSLMKCAFAPFLTPRVMGRISKGYAAPFFQWQARANAASALSSLDSMELVKRGVIDRERLRRALNAIVQGSNRQVGNVSAILRCERWLDRYARRRPSSQIRISA